MITVPSIFLQFEADCYYKNYDKDDEESPGYAYANRVRATAAIFVVFFRVEVVLVVHVVVAAVH